MNSRGNTIGTMRIFVCVAVATLLITAVTGSILHWIPTVAGLMVGAMALRSMATGNRRR